MVEAKVELIIWGRKVGDALCQVHVRVNDGDAKAAFMVAQNEVNTQIAAHSQKHSKYEQRAAAAAKCEFVNTETGEAFDCADNGRFQTILKLLLDARDIPAAKRNGLYEYVLTIAKLPGFGEMNAPDRLKFLNGLSAGEYDKFKQTGIIA